MKLTPYLSRRHRILVALAAALSLAATAATFPLAESPWPMYRKDPAHTGRSTVRGPGAATVRWVFSAGARDKAGGIETDPAIGPDGTVYVGANNGIFYALDGKTGEIRWVYPTLFEEDAIYSSALVARDGSVIFGGKDGIVLALTAPREGILGRLVWSARIPATIETSPALAPDGTLYVGGGDWSMYAIAPPADGGTAARILWGFPTGGSLVSSPAVASDGTLYFGSMDGKLYALEPAPGGRPRVKWTFTTGRTGEQGGIENAPAIAPDGTLYVGANNGLFYALDPGSGRVKWSFKTGYTTYAIFSSAAVWHDGAAIFGAKDGNLYVLHGENGRVAWGYRIGQMIETSPAMGGDGTVYIGADDGKIYAVAPPPRGDRGTLRWSFQTGGQLISSPALGADGTLYEGSMDGKLYAIGSPTTLPKPEPLTGTWYGTHEDPRTRGHLAMVLVQRGARIEGAWRIFPAGARGALSGDIQGQAVTFTLHRRDDPCPGTYRGRGQVSGKELRGTYEGEDCRGTVSGQFDARLGP